MYKVVVYKYSSSFKLILMDEQTIDSLLNLLLCALALKMTFKKTIYLNIILNVSAKGT